MFDDTDKFDGTNWPTWSNNILSISALKGVTGYLNGFVTGVWRVKTRLLDVLENTNNEPHIM